MFVIGLAAAAGWVLGLVLLPLIAWLLMEAAVTAVERSSALVRGRRHAPAAERRERLLVPRA